MQKIKSPQNINFMSIFLPLSYYIDQDISKILGYSFRFYIIEAKQIIVSFG